MTAREELVKLVRGHARSHWAALYEHDVWLNEVADALELAQEPGKEGWVMVPREPTIDMIVAGTEDWLCVRAMEDRAEVIWKAMLAAAPPPEATSRTPQAMKEAPCKS